MHYRYLLLVTALVFAGCAHRAIEPVDPYQWQKRQSTLAGFAAIGYRARASVVSEEKAWQFSLDWQQRGNRFSGSGYSLLGSKLFDISGDENTTSYHTGKEQQQLPSSEVIHEFTGLDLSPSQLFGLLAAMPLAQSEQRWQEGRLASQTFGETSVRYLDWERYAGLHMPKRVKISSQGNQLSLSFSDWTFTQSENPAVSLF